MRIGIFGGTFDPIHLGHLILAEQCRESAGLDEVWFLPSYKPPHKSDRELTRFDQRCEMVTLATTGQPLFRLEPIERELPPPSYTTQTLAELKVRYPEHTFSLVLGADCLPDLPGWYQPQRILEQAELIVVPRPGIEFWNHKQLATALGIHEDQVRMQVVKCPLIEIASRDLRRRVADSHTIRYLVPRAVEEYIRERKLYRA